MIQKTTKSRQKNIYQLIGLVILMFFFLNSCKPEQETKMPNVLFIAIDDLNDWIEPLGGHPQTITPNLSRLAERSVIFTNAECASPACVPSRTAMFTGILPQNTGYYNNLAGFYRNDENMKDVVTLAEYLGDHGYYTAGAGKITHHFDTLAWDSLWTKPYWINPSPEWYEKFNGNRVREWVPVDATKEEMTDWKFAEWAADMLKKEYDKPFFIGCGFFRPHEPWFVPKEYYDKFGPDTLQLPQVKKDDLEDVGELVRNKNSVAEKCFADTGLWRQGVQAYLASINFADDCLGHVLDALDDSPHKDNTIIMLWSDHGWHLGEKFNWSKFKLWEESARCVLMCHAPGVTTPNTRCDAPVNLVDIFPTLQDLCGIPAKEGLDGISFMPQLKDPSVKREKPSLTANEVGFSLRTEQYRYIWYHDGSEELYDHREDPLEWNNLANSEDYQNVKAQLKEFVPTSYAEVRNIRELRKAKEEKANQKE